MENKRLTAVKTCIADVTRGRFVKQEGFNPSYVISPDGMRLSRVRIMATVVDKFVAESGKFSSLTLDDGTDTIRSKAFSSSFFESTSQGDIVDVIGKVKEYQGEIYINPEVVAKQDDPNTETLRMAELRVQRKAVDEKRRAVIEAQKSTADADELKKIMQERYGMEPEETEAILASMPTDEEKESPKDALLKIIAENDAGEGCEYAVIIAKSGLGEDAIDAAVQELLDEGSCFEPKPGKIKKL
ncbi:MAG: hypothetical protein HY365_01130 [Candidatus Aenigmarchaeota archaeon]|nr:hypothetical protein [Candidatus Aenigmarchaeota archaeon]